MIHFHIQIQELYIPEIKDNTKHDAFEKDDIVSLTLDLNQLSLSYDITRDTDTCTCSEKEEKKQENKHGILIKAGELKKLKYKWAFALYQSGLSVTILDVYML